MYSRIDTYLHNIIVQNFNEWRLCGIHTSKNECERDKRAFIPNTVYEIILVSIILFWIKFKITNDI